MVESAVRALLESVKLRLYDAFSAQMAHWSSDRFQYGPFISVGAGSSSLCGGMGRSLLRKGRRDVREIGFTCAVRRAKRRRRVRVLISGRINIKNSYPSVKLSEALYTQVHLESLTVKACQTI